MSSDRSTSAVRRLTRVLIVDDSAYARKVMREMLSESPFIEVVGVACDGQDALRLTEECRPDVVTLDLQMPTMDGLDYLRDQMARRPLPVIVCSIVDESAEMAIRAIGLGALDFIQKPSAFATGSMYELRDELIEKVKAAGNASMEHLKRVIGPAGRSAPLQTGKVGEHRIDMVVLGISTGGPQALRFLIPQFPPDIPVPMAAVMHMPVGYTEAYANSLNEMSALEVREARDGDELRPGTLLLAKAGYHLSLHRDASGTATARLDTNPANTSHRPAVDVLFQSAADVFGDRVLGVVMTGMGTDGRQGAAWIKAKGGLVYTEAEESCVVYGMPGSTVEAGLSDKSVLLQDMAQAIIEVV